MTEQDGTERTARVLVLTPDQTRLKPEVLTKPFILYAIVEHPTELSTALALPNVMEVLGGPSGGGGPPGFCALQTRGAVKEKRLVLIAGFLAGNEIRLNSQYFTVVQNLGGVASTAVVVTYFRLAARDPYDLDLELTYDVDTPEGVEELIRRTGYAPIPLVEYETPPMILNAIKAQPAPVVVPG